MRVRLKPHPLFLRVRIVTFTTGAGDLLVSGWRWLKLRTSARPPVLPCRSGTAVLTQTALTGGWTSISVCQVGVRIVPVGHGNWRAVADLEVAEDQRQFVGPTTGYLALTHLGDQGWAPLAILADGELVGFMMWAHDPTDDACWVGGVLVDRAHQRRGHGRSAMQALIGMARESGAPSVKLSYDSENSVARTLYASLGFRETGETVGDEIVVALNLEG